LSEQILAVVKNHQGGWRNYCWTSKD